MAWWGDSLDNGSFQPKQKNRFVVKFGRGGTLLSVKSVTKPSVSIASKEYRLMNHYYNYPGIPKWEAINIRFVDGKIWGASDFKPGTPPNEDSVESEISETASKKDSGSTTSGQLWEMLLATGYVNQKGVGADIKGLARVVSPEKAAMIDVSFGASTKKSDSSNSMRIMQLNPEGVAIETWVIYNPIITKISWGDLDYGSDELVEYSLDITYDWAELSEKEQKP